MFPVYTIYQKQMTSWILAKSQTQKRPELKGLFFETTDAGFCSNFNQFLYAYAFSLSEARPLEVYDLSSPVSITYPLIKNTFEEIEGVTYKDSMSITSSSMRRLMPRIMSNAMNLPMASLRGIAQRIFQWNSSLIKSLEGILVSANLPKKFDLGIHIRVGDRIVTRDRKSVTVEEYIRAAKKVQVNLKKENMNIFLMSDSVNAIAEFKKKADSSWKIYTLPQNLPNPEGHIQAQFNKAAPRARMSAYQSFIAELIVMQSVQDIICTFSSNVGRFLFYTVEFPDRIISLDEKLMVK